MEHENRYLHFKFFMAFLLDIIKKSIEIIAKLAHGIIVNSIKPSRKNYLE